MILLRCLLAVLALIIPSAQCDSDFDLFLLVREWDPGYCSTGSCKRQPKGANFTLHGLWPEYARGTWPQFCRGPAFNPGKLDSIIDELEAEWPSFQETDYNFWEHEWSKHGTCAHSVLKDELAYFSKALELHERFDFLSALRENGISPSDEWQRSLGEVKAALDSGTGVEGSTQLSCKQHTLVEVKTCMSKAFEPIPCPKRVGEGACDPVRIPDLPDQDATASGGILTA